jgi:hypothetical protein
VGYQLDDTFIKKLKEIIRKVDGIPVSALAPVRRKTREIGGSDLPDGFWCYLTKDGGADGSSGVSNVYGAGTDPSYATWTYTAYSIGSTNIEADQLIGHHISVLGQRLLMCETITATIGYVIVDGKLASSSSSSSSGSSPWNVVGITWCDEAYYQVGECVPSAATSSSSSGG